MVISTLLGSCVTITLFSRRQGLGAICHILLPKCRPDETGKCPEPFHHADCALEGMLAFFARWGVLPRALQAKVFGGADMFRTRGGSATVGAQNVARVRQLLAAAGIPEVAADVGGTSGRKLIFHPHTGDVFIKKLGRPATIFPEESGGEVA